MSDRRDRGEWKLAGSEGVDPDILQLRRIVEESGNLSNAAILISGLGVGKVDHSTLSRWLDPARSTEKAPARLTLAMENYLRIQAQKAPILTFAVPGNALSYSTILAYSKYAKHYDDENEKYDDEKYYSNLLIKRSDPIAVPKGFVVCKSGGEALDMLISGEVMFALASREIYENDKMQRANAPGKSIHRLWETATGKVMGIAFEEILTPSGLDGKRFGFPANSTHGSRIAKALLAAHPLSFSPRDTLFPYPSALLAAKAMLNGSVDCLVGPDSWLDEAREFISSESKDETRKIHYTSALFGEQSFCLFANEKYEWFTPLAVRSCLQRLLDIERISVGAYTRELKELFLDTKAKNSAEPKKDKKRGRPRKIDTPDKTVEIEYKIRDVDLEKLIKFWSREVSSHRQMGSSNLPPE
jgi:ABC-type nitrate/sulfonate/bicarbonate transport system substrate-binding protein